MLGFVLYIIYISSSMQLWYFHHCHTVCSCRGIIKIKAYLNDSRKHWICWKRVGCGQLGDLLYTLVPTLHQFLARRQCEIKRTQNDNCVSNCCPNCAPLETTAMIFHLFMTKKQGGTECQLLVIASL
ncbi:unnamed protein product [Sphagnum troendelagicum]|uniref:Secreted protein n=1 Tax=Sphagnum troendelagicum TaxID=128251 RepID=A0ABP0UGW6_9BRYO